MTSIPGFSYLSQGRTGLDVYLLVGYRIDETRTHDSVVFRFVPSTFRFRRRAKLSLEQTYWRVSLMILDIAFETSTSSNCFVCAPFSAIHELQMYTDTIKLP